MRHHYKIQQYDDQFGAFICTSNSDGSNLAIVLDFECENPNDLIGKNLSVSHLNILLAQGVKCKIEN